jgi:hypothetical protein
VICGAAPDTPLENNIEQICLPAHQKHLQSIDGLARFGKM